MESLNDILEYTEAPEGVTKKDNQTRSNEVAPTAKHKSQNDKNQIADQKEIIKLIKIYLKEFPEETKEWSKKAKDMDSLDDDQLEELKTNVIRSVNSVSSLDTIADNSVLVLNLYEYLMESVFPVPGISASLGKNPAFKGTVKKILLKYLGTSLYTEMSPEFSLVAMVFQTSILCNTLGCIEVKGAKQSENTPPTKTEDNFDDL